MLNHAMSKPYLGSKDLTVGQKIVVIIFIYRFSNVRSHIKYGTEHTEHIL